MSNITVALINATTVLQDADIQPVVSALQTQVSRDFAPIWGTDAHLVFVPKGQNPPLGSWWLALLDNSDVAGALGYHDVSIEGLPIGKVFAATDIQYGTSWSVTASHELLEMLGDPDVNLTVMTDRGHKHTLWAYETADAVEADKFGYTINGVLVSDFVYPAYFESFRKTGPFDHRGLIKAPFTLLPGGYMSEYNFSGGGWTQITADGKLAAEGRAKVGSRRERRRTPREHWLHSTAHTK